ncbi:hypothetical protein, partial [Paraburkholderia ribeironis]|uniref:hypothetical protein n=1 Tax=Paraburkholderia ribeironis TaxID=1247936 RepID=UPI001C3F58F0
PGPPDSDLHRLKSHASRPFSHRLKKQNPTLRKTWGSSAVCGSPSNGGAFFFSSIVKLVIA